MTKISSRSVFVPFLVTTLCLAISIALDFIEFPFARFGMQTDILDLFNQTYRLGQQGLLPLITGFFIIEMLALFLPPFKAWRSGGLAGRKRLNGFALGLTALDSIFMAWTPSAAIAQNSGQLLAHQPYLVMGWLIGGFVIRLGLIRLIDRKGVGNGVSLIVVAVMFSQLSDIIPRNFGILWKDLAALPQKDRVLQSLLILTMVAVTFFALKKIFSKKPTFEVNHAGKEFRVRSPYLPQSLLMYLIFAGLIAASAALGTSLQSDWLFNFATKLTSPYFSYLAPVITVGLAYFGYFLFSTGRRVEWAIDDKGSFDKKTVSAIHLRGAFYSAALLAVVIFCLHNPILRVDFQLGYLLNFESLLVMIAVGLDCRANWKFILAHGIGRKILSFDNVYLASLVRAELENAEIPHRVAGFQHRRLFFATQPVIKMALFVPEKDFDRANALVDVTNLKRI